MAIWNNLTGQGHLPLHLLLHLLLPLLAMKRRKLPTSDWPQDNPSKDSLSKPPSLMSTSTRNWAITLVIANHILLASPTFCPFLVFQLPIHTPLGYTFCHVLGHVLQLERSHQLQGHNHQPHLVCGYQLHQDLSWWATGCVQLLHNACNHLVVEGSFIMKYYQFQNPSGFLISNCLLTQPLQLRVCI